MTEVLVIVGMSGAGRSSAGNVLEDLGWYVVDNLPVSLLPSLVDRIDASTREVDRVAVAVDARDVSLLERLREVLAELTRRGHSHRLLFLDAGDESLVRRFESVRRPHPLQADGRLLDAIHAEREQLSTLRSVADVVIDTSHLNVHQFAAKVTRVFTGGDEPSLRVTVMSFGFKYGLPLDADHVADVRFLPNPYWIPELRPRTGLDEPVSRFVLAQEGAAAFLSAYRDALALVLAGYVRENKRYATVAIGCTGGKHRSVAMSEALAVLLKDEGVAPSTVHRDLGRE